MSNPMPDPNYKVSMENIQNWIVKRKRIRIKVVYNTLKMSEIDQTTVALWLVNVKKEKQANRRIKYLTMYVQGNKR